MWKFVKGLFGGSDTADKAMDLATSSITGIGEWIDNKDYTNQEKAKDLNLAVQSHLKLIETMANENSLRSVTRRWLAWGIVGFTVFWASVAMVFAALGSYEIVNSMIKVMEAFKLGMAFVAVIALYFGVQFIRK